jgi:DHA1 family multidrug resistance protein-like MFS transporter
VYYNFTAQSTGLVFLCVAPAAALAFTIHVIYLKYRVFPRLTNGTFGELVGLFIYGKQNLP